MRVVLFILFFAATLNARGHFGQTGCIQTAPEWRDGIEAIFASCGTISIGALAAPQSQNPPGLKVTVINGAIGTLDVSWTSWEAKFSDGKKTTSFPATDPAEAVKIAAKVPFWQRFAASSAAVAVGAGSTTVLDGNGNPVAIIPNSTSTETAERQKQAVGALQNSANTAAKTLSELAFRRWTLHTGESATGLIFFKDAKGRFLEATVTINGERLTLIRPAD